MRHCSPCAKNINLAHWIACLSLSYNITAIWCNMKCTPNAVLGLESANKQLCHNSYTMHTFPNLLDSEFNNKNNLLFLFLVLHLSMEIHIHKINK